MSRRDTGKKKTGEFDPLCGSRIVNMLVNHMMKHGKKSLAYQIFYRAAIYIRKKTKENPIFLLRRAILRIAPRLVLKTKRRKNGKIYKVPVAIKFRKASLLGIRWLLGGSRKRSGTSMASQLSEEIIDAASKKRGNAIRKKEEIYKMAEASRTFAHSRYKKKRGNAIRKPGNAIRKPGNAIQKPGNTTLKPGNAIRKREEINRMAEASRTFILVTNKKEKKDKT